MSPPTQSWYVIKIGGELALDIPKLSRTVGQAVAAFLQTGKRIAVVHGGGPQATELSARLGLATTQVAGQRVTDKPTLEVMKQALGAVGINVASALRLAGVKALATSGASAGLVDATRRPPMVVAGHVQPVDYGLVGDIAHVDVTLLQSLADIGIVPVISCLAGDAEGRVYNVNADTVATRLASSLQAQRLFLVSNVAGVLKDRNDSSTRIARLTPKEAKAHIASGAIQGGMIPKVQESLALLEHGIEAIHILGLTPETALFDEAQTPGSRGTVFVKDS